MSVRTLLLVCAFVSGTAAAYADTRTPAQHLMTVDVQAGYACTAGSTVEAMRLDVRPGWGVSPAIGLGYMLRKGHLLFNVGATVAYAVCTNRAGTDLILGTTSIARGTTDMTQSVTVSVPVMFGGEWSRVYFMGGLGPSVSVYDRMQRLDGGRQYKVTRMPQLLFHSEVGGTLGASADGKARFMLAAYIHCGLLNERPVQRKGSYADGVPYYISDESTADIVTGLNVGVKFTCVLDFTAKQKTEPCE